MVHLERDGDALTQYSLFGAEAAGPGPDDLDGLLLGGAQWVRSAGGARLSVVVAERWRAETLAAAFADLALDGPEPVVAATSGYGVRTGFRPELAGHAARWTRGAHQGLPAGVVLTAGGLRLWAIAAGRRDETGYLLRTAAADDPVHRAAGAQLSRLGVTAVAVARGGPGWRVTSARRLRRLVELLGAPPPDAPPGWPLGDSG